MFSQIIVAEVGGVAEGQLLEGEDIGVDCFGVGDRVATEGVVGIKCGSCRMERCLSRLFVKCLLNWELRSYC